MRPAPEGAAGKGRSPQRNDLDWPAQTLASVGETVRRTCRTRVSEFCRSRGLVRIGIVASGDLLLRLHERDAARIEIGIMAPMIQADVSPQAQEVCCTVIRR